MSDQPKFAAFVAQHKLDARRILAASHKLESLKPEDRAIKAAKGKAKKAEGGEKDVRKPRTGRPVTERAMAAALHGGEVSGPTKQRILRAVNHLLEQKKKDKVELKVLF